MMGNAARDTGSIVRFIRTSTGDAESTRGRPLRSGRLNEPMRAANTNLTTGKELRESDDLDRCRVCVPALLVCTRLERVDAYLDCRRQQHLWTFGGAASRAGWTRLRLGDERPPRKACAPHGEICGDFIGPRPAG